MKISKVRIKNLFGITEYEADGKDLELIGKEGTGKTSVLDAIKYAFTNKSDRRYLIRNGEKEGEIYIETDTGLSITRKARTDKADYKSIKVAGDRVEKTEGFLREIFTELQLNPIEFVDMPEAEQNRIILDLIEFKWDLNWIKEQFGEIVPGVNYEQNILCVLNDIQAERGHYFLSRESINREVRNKAAFIEEIGKTLPEGYDAKKWEGVSLGEIHKKIEAIRNRNEQITNAKNIVEGQTAKRDNYNNWLTTEKQRLNNAEKDDVNEIRKEVEELTNRIKALNVKVGETQKTYTLLHDNAQKQYEAAVAKMDGEVKQFEDVAKEEVKPFDELQAEAATTETMKGYVNEHRRMTELQKDVEKLTAESKAFTDKIEKARRLPGEILEKAQVPIEGLTIKAGIPLINGLPISNLSSAEKFELCIRIATRNANSLQMILLDGIERMATIKRNQVYADLKAKGVQFIATRTTDEDALTVIEL